MESPEAYIPIDRRRAMAQGRTMPDRTRGTGLFADLSGFTALTDVLVQVLGPKRGAEELPTQLNRVYDAMIAEVHHYGGTVIGFAGDAITCWFDDDDASHATACALAMQQAMQPFAAVPVPGAGTVALAVKVAIAAGSARRFVVGDPAVQRIDVLAGATLDRLAAGEHHAERGEVLLDAEASRQLGARLTVAAWRAGDAPGERFAVVTALAGAVAPTPWPALTPGALDTAEVRAWLLPPVYERLQLGRGEFLTELRPGVSLFLRFGGIDYDRDVAAGSKLDAYVRWVQTVLTQYGGFLIQLTIGDKGSYLYAAFGAPVAHPDDASRAVAAALELRRVPPELACIRNIQIGIS
ncbi:MAG TPA: adenylate/guanylate cyclase domain-containing protein, partial [Herpetosiphonaceae bacterium]|nr:adenylate/guanylate cyclase domain-containing protein [Herpetosiphonaceae bacterium]